MRALVGENRGESKAIDPIALSIDLAMIDQVDKVQVQMIKDMKIYRGSNGDLIGTNVRKTFVLEKILTN